jgi:Amt family ammonium transporter
MGFGGTLAIMKVLDVLIGVRVSREVEDIGLDIGEHAERAYSDEEEFHSDFDKEEGKEKVS